MFTDASRVEVMVDDVVYSGSAFGVTIQGGEGVFINQRIVETMKVKPGDKVIAYLLPNYPDKRDSIPWRAMRVEIIGSIFENTTEEDAPVAEASIEDRILEALDKHGPMRTAVIARLVGRDAGEVQTLCLGLWASKRIAMADVFKEPNQKRSSHRVWAVSIWDFDVDPFEDEPED